jgi:hypothetical protein
MSDHVTAGVCHELPYGDVRRFTSEKITVVLGARSRAPAFACRVGSAGGPQALDRKHTQGDLPHRRIGFLRDGYEASFLALEGNPLEDWRNVRRITLRFKQGLEVQ